MSIRARYPVAVCLLPLVSVLLALNLAEAQGTSGQWSEPINITESSGSTIDTFGLLLCDAYQNAHLFWADLSQEDAAIFYRNDLAETWSVPVDVLVIPMPVIAELHGDISNNDNTLHLVWLDQHFMGNLYYSRASLIEAGEPRAWAQPITFASEVWNAAINVDSAGVIHIVYSVTEDEGVLPTVYHISSKDGGMSWSDPAIVYSAPFDLPSYSWVLMDIDDADRIHLGITIRAQEYGIYSEVGYVRSEDGGLTWSEYKQIDRMGTTFQGVHRIAPYAFGENEIHLTWHDPRRMHVWSLDGGQTWQGPVEIMALGAAFGGPNMLAKDSAGTLWVVTAVGSGVFSAAWDGARWAAPERIDGRAIDAHGQNMVVCQGNRLHSVYYDRLGDQKVWYSSRQVDAPHIARRPLPDSAPEAVALAPDATPWGEPSAVPSGPTATPDHSWGDTTPEPSASPWISLLAAAGLVAILVGSVAIVKRWPKRR